MKKIVFICLTLLATACTDGFDELNTNSNQAETVNASLLLPTVIIDYADLMVNQNYSFGNTIGQYATNYEFNDIDIFNWTSDDRFWPIYSILQDVKDIELVAQSTGHVNYEAIAIILESFGISILTDVYGDVPYREATQAIDGIFTPKYDEQQAIYQELLAELARANELIDVDGTVNGDILYGGDMMKWKKFANSLRLRLLLRSSKAQDNSAALQAIVNNPTQSPIFESNADNADYQYSGDLPDLSPLSTGRGRAYDYYLGIPTTHIIDRLKANNDPRLEEWFDPKAGTTEYLGTAPGQSIGDVGRPDEFSSKAAAYFDVANKISGIFMTYSEVSFILAEAAESGLITGDAKTYYDAGVSASFDQWGVTMPADYLTSTAPYDANTEVLAIQKWLSLYHNSLQGWLNWKRTGLPSFIAAGPGTVNDGKFPVRLMYPALEQSVNNQNYTAAAANIQGDNINSRVWWDK
ncbi:MAG: SusD/RagB family nutrient-binding outer membrane lipoprotein [Flammeovirgaceae bacterium]